MTLLFEDAQETRPIQVSHIYPTTISNSSTMTKIKRPLQRRKSATNFRIVAFIIAVFVVAVPFLLPKANKWQSAAVIPGVDDIHTGADITTDFRKFGATPVYGTHFKINNNSTDVVYALPNASKFLSLSSLKGIALLLHGCSHSAFKFFSPSPKTCPDCIGLSEELRINRILLRRGYATIAVSSTNRQSGCWGGPFDISHVQEGLDKLREIIVALSPDSTRSKNQISDPSFVVAVGASSGGHFAAALASRRVVTGGALVMVSTLGPQVRRQLIAQWQNGIEIAPLYLAPMAKDERTTMAAQQDCNMLHAAFESLSPKQKTMLNNWRYSIFFDSATCGPIPVSPEYLNQRVPMLTLEMATQIVSSMLNAGHLDDLNGLVVDPTRSDWRDILKSSCASRGCLDNQALDAGKSPLAKALHRAWAVHEYCSESVEPALNFFETMRSSIE